jgi:hypothetical protein
MPTHKLFLLHSHTPNDRAVLVAAPDMNHARDRINVSPTGMESCRSVCRWFTETVSWCTIGSRLKGCESWTAKALHGAMDHQAVRCGPDLPADERRIHGSLVRAHQGLPTY